MIPSYQLQGSCLFMSDLHLNGGARDEVALKALQFIAEGGLAVSVRHILLVGDLFDFNLGYRSIYPHLAPVYELLFKLADRGLKLWIFTGNHDPDPCPHLAQRPGVTLLTGPALFQLAWDSADGERQERLALIEHGDLCEERWVKRALCRVARLRFTCWLARRLPPNVALKLAPRLPQHLNERRSPHRHSVDEALHNASPAALSARWVKHLASLTSPRLPPSLWVMGHFHEVKLTALKASAPQGLKVSSPPTHVPTDLSPKLALLGDWVQLFTCLLFEQGRLSLYQHHPSPHLSSSSFTLIKQSQLR